MTAPAPASSDLAGRYGAPAPWRRPVLIAATTALAAVFLGWVAWAAWAHGTPAAESAMVSFDVQSDSSAVAHIDVQLEGDDVTATCRVRAFAVDHTTVGEISFNPVQGRNDVEIRTERRATSIDLIGCTAPGQDRPR